MQKILIMRAFKYAVIACSSAAFVLLVSSAVQAASIGVQFYCAVSGSGYSTTPALSASNYAGLVDAANGYNFVQKNWRAIGISYPATNTNSGMLNASYVIDDSGSANTMGVKVGWTDGSTSMPTGSIKSGVVSTGVSSSSTANSSGYYQKKLMGGYLLANSTTYASSCTFTNVSATSPLGGDYIVVVYFLNYDLSYTEVSLSAGSGTNPITGTSSLYVLEQGGTDDTTNNSVANGVFDGSTFISNPVDSSSTAAPTAVSNYAIFTDVTPDSNGNIAITWNKTDFESPSGYSSYAGVCAVQLIWVPEPTIGGLIICGMSLLIARKRH